VNLRVEIGQNKAKKFLESRRRVTVHRHSRVDEKIQTAKSVAPTSGSLTSLNVVSVPSEIRTSSCSPHSKLLVNLDITNVISQQWNLTSPDNSESHRGTIEKLQSTNRFRVSLESRKLVSHDVAESETKRSDQRTLDPSTPTTGTRLVGNTFRAFLGITSQDPVLTSSGCR
jgi:hypothetical protein